MHVFISLFSHIFFFSSSSLWTKRFPCHSIYIYIYFFFLFHEHCSFIFYQPCFLPFLCIYREQNFKHKEWTLNNILISVKPDKPTSVRLSMALSGLQYLFEIGLCRDLLSSAINKLSLLFTGELFFCYRSLFL